MSLPGPATREARASERPGRPTPPLRRDKRILAVVLGLLLGAALTGIGVGALFHAPESHVVRREPSLRVIRPSAARTPNDVATGEQPTTQKERAVRPPTPRAPTRARQLLPALVAADEWPSEPVAPHPVEDARFLEALATLCGPHADAAVRPWYGPWILQAARSFEADPFMLGALFFRESECVDAQRAEGMLNLDSALYRADMRGHSYRYTAFAQGTWVPRQLSLSAFPYSPEFVRNPQSSLYFAAAFLRAWEDQVRGLRAAFVQPTEYRSYVSHYFWGDQVQSNREEDAVLVARRRLLEYYGATTPQPPVAWRGFELGCPLDGCPRVVTSTLGDAREDGKRLHAGNDFESYRGEPVRAAADGQIVFAGVDLPGRGAASKLPIWAQKNLDSSEMGAGGLYICIDHGQRHHERLITCYMHLEAAMVAQGRWVKRGEQIGRVGTSGIRQSRPHLHFELHSNHGAQRATDLMHPLALGHPPTHAATKHAKARHRLATSSPTEQRRRSH